MHRYRIREIAEQAGVSEATVDRVLNARPGVRATTAAQVARAVTELDRQRDQLQLSGRRFVVDLVMQAPHRFSTTVQRALEAELPDLRPAALRCRFHLREDGSPTEVAAVLARIGRRGTAGVLLKAQDDPDVVEAVERLHDQGIPVITLVTDLPQSRRIAYVGMDNRAAGGTAAYLIHHLSHHRSRHMPDTAVLITLSRTSFRGEEERELGFRATLAELDPGRRMVELTETDGLDAALFQSVSDALAENPDIGAVYSVGGGNTATLEAFRLAGRSAEPFVAHDLDADNRALLRQRRITAVLHHDLRADLRAACQLVLRAHRALPGPPLGTPSAIQVVTPYNLPR